MRTRILLAEDDVDEQLFFKNFLTGRTDFVLLPPVGDGEELLTYLESRRTTDTSLPEAIILDQNMPKMNGLQALTLLKETKEYMRIPVLLYSTYVDNDFRKKCLGIGADFVVAKPQDRQGYHLMIDNLLKLVK